MLFIVNVTSVIQGTLSLLKNPSDTDSVYDIEDGLRESWMMRLSLRHVMADKATNQVMAERYIAPSPDLEALLKLPADSLGYQYASSLIKAGFDPNFYRSIVVEDEVSYLLLRLRQTHDIWHIVTGFGVDIGGELGLKAFEVSQTRRPMAIILLMGGLLAALRQSPHSFYLLWNQIKQGYRLGKQANPFLAQKWEQNWEKPLRQWRQELKII